MRRLVDLSHVVEDGMVTYPGLPGPIITDHLSREASQAHYAQGTTFHIGRIEMVGNTGTYIDAPFHRYADGKDLSELALEQVADLEGLVFRADPSRRAIGPELFGRADVRGRPSWCIRAGPSIGARRPTSTATPSSPRRQQRGWKRRARPWSVSTP